MRQDIYYTILELVQEQAVSLNRGVHIPVQSMARDHLTEAIKKNNSKNLSLTIKNYVGRRGLSEHIFNNIRYQEQVEVKGPLGTGL